MKLLHNKTNKTDNTYFRPSTAISHRPSAIDHRPSIIHHPSSIIHHPSSTIQTAFYKKFFA